MNNRRALQPSEMNPHAKALIQYTTTAVLAFGWVMLAAYLGGF